ncbi:hypothetical protein Ptr902_12194 [Pyrenophora tritici-repentis]|nr:hypothetical protein Ptr902_13843 [Pyrenophora tritici-repentis]KAI2476315.1 hypothetical protein Ptr902_12194 [Pyrenophora tritici-repentis]
MASSSARDDQVVSRALVILENQSDWKLWYSLKKEFATVKGVWEYCDPSTNKLPQPAPAEPTPAEPTPAQPTEQAATEQVEPPPAEEMEPPPAEQMDTSPAEQVELNPKPIERRRGRPRKLTTAPPTTVSRDERVPDLATKESEEPVQSLPEAPRYFTRGSKRKRAGEDTAEDERFRKIIKAMLAQPATIVQQQQKTIDTDDVTGRSFQPSLSLRRAYKGRLAKLKADHLCPVPSKTQT